MFDARTRARLQQRDVCKALGISASTLSEAERVAHGSSQVARFAALYQVSAQWLTTGDGLMDEADANLFTPRLSPAATELAQRFDAAPPAAKRILYAVLLDEIRKVTPPADSPTQPPDEPPTAAPLLTTGTGRGRRRA